MSPSQINRLLAGLPATVDASQRRRIDGYATAAHRCDQRIAALRAELESALRDLGEAPAAGNAVEPADEAISVALELDALERVQSRIDSWLRIAVGAFADDPGPAPFGEGPA